jgi:hypothetical protein
MRSVIEGPANWRGTDILKSPDWIHVFSADELAEIDRALRGAQAQGVTFATLTTANFPLPRVSGLMAAARELLEDGPGLKLFRGTPAERYSKDELRLIYWGLGKHLGTAISQSPRGDVLGDVRDLGIDTFSPKGRGYTSNQQLSFHCDSCDVVGLFVLRTAKSGGLSKIASSVAVRNEIARTRPDLLEVLYQPFYWSWQGQEPPGERPWYPQPIYTEHAGRFASRYIRTHIRNAQRFPEVPRLTAAQEEAMTMIDTVAAREDMHFSMMFEPGDLQFINNHIAYHSRTAFEDHPEPDRHRHLLRMWLSVPNSRALSPDMATIYRDVSAGAVRGGFPSRTGTHVYETIGTFD